jgi:hypothetical protein
VQPGFQHVLDVTAAARVREPALDATFGHDEQRRRLLDTESLDEVGTLVDIDLVEDERSVVLATLEYLGDEAFNPAATSAHLGVEEHQLRASLRYLL